MIDIQAKVDLFYVSDNIYDLNGFNFGYTRVIRLKMEAYGF